MTRTNYRLTLALALSLLLHLAPFLEMLLQPPPKPAPPPPLQAQIRPPPAPLPAQVPLTLPESLPAPVATAPKANPPAKKILTAPTGTRSWQEEIRQQFRKQHERKAFYPAEAIAQGIQGEALVLLILNESGQVAAARIEQSSGYQILDDAALRAVRALRSLPADAPRETLLPVRFRLR